MLYYIDGLCLFKKKTIMDFYFNFQWFFINDLFLIDPLNYCRDVNFSFKIIKIKKYSITIF